MVSLEASIKQRGQIQPGLVKELEGQDFDFELVDGQRRWTACARLKIPFCAVIVEPENEAEQYEISVTANFQSSSHTPMEIAKACCRLYEAGRSEIYIGNLFGKSPFWVSRYMYLAHLIPELQEMLDPAIIPSRDDRLPVTLAQDLARLDEDSQRRRYKQIQRDGVQTLDSNIVRRELRDSGEIAARTMKPSGHGRMIDGFLDRFQKECGDMQRRLEQTAGLLPGLRKTGKLDQIAKKVDAATVMLARVRRIIHQHIEKREAS